MTLSAATFIIAFVIDERIWSIGGVDPDRGKLKCSDIKPSQCYFVDQKSHMD